MCFNFNAWHASCYKQHPKDKFLVLNILDVDDSLVDDERMEVEDTLRFQEARDADYMMVTFVCNECVFWDLREQHPVPGCVRDEMMKICIRRVILDSFWARERSTVAANCREGLKYLDIHTNLGEQNPYKPRGPWDVSDDQLGYRAAIGMVMRSMDEGMYADYIQYETTRRIRSHVSNFEHTTPGRIGATRVGQEGRATFMSEACTNSPWFRRFAVGCHRRMGNIWRPDCPMNMEELKAAFEILEEDWRAYGSDLEGQMQTCLTAMIIIMGFFAALRGKKS
mmetsp:Transcript_29975/g.45445  ORF Transcript_29975/g.45445 Transcript_29975/m.45445 type:complete len:281 (+) Transcript_29975:269-1111(+)